MIESEKLVIQPLAYIRGRSFSNIFIIDEAQNLTPHEVKTIISRAGKILRLFLLEILIRLIHHTLTHKVMVYHI